jgi:hypothetical protein
MTKKTPDVKPGIELDLGVVGMAATKWAGSADIGPDYSDCVVAIEPCGEDVFELWLHAEGRQSVCLLASKEVFSELGRALSCLVDSRDIVSNKGAI